MMSLLGEDQAVRTDLRTSQSVIEDDEGRYHSEKRTSLATEISKRSLTASCSFCLPSDKLVRELIFAGAHGRLSREFGMFLDRPLGNNIRLNHDSARWVGLSDNGKNLLQDGCLESPHGTPSIAR